MDNPTPDYEQGYEDGSLDTYTEFLDQIRTQARVLSMKIDSVAGHSVMEVHLAIPLPSPAGDLFTEVMQRPPSVQATA